MVEHANALYKFKALFSHLAFHMVCTQEFSPIPCCHFKDLPHIFSQDLLSTVAFF